MEENMSRPSSPRRFTVLLPLLLVAVYLIAPVNQVQAQECIEYTVWNPQTQRCECPDQACCDFYCPFIPYGCPDKGSEGCPETGAAMVEKLTSSAALVQLQYKPQREINGARFLRMEFLSYTKAMRYGA
jgi:hypothetical protein